MRTSVTNMFVSVYYFIYFYIPLLAFLVNQILPQTLHYNYDNCFYPTPSNNHHRRKSMKLSTNVFRSVCCYFGVSHIQFIFDHLIYTSKCFSNVLKKCILIVLLLNKIFLTCLSKVNIFWSINIVSKDDGNWVLCRKKPNFYKNDRHVMSRLMFWFLVFVMPRHNILCLYLLSIITNCGLCCTNTAINIICHLAYTKSLLPLFRNLNHFIHTIISSVIITSVIFEVGEKWN